MTITRNDLQRSSATPSFDLQSTREEIDAAVAVLQSHKDEWLALTISDRIDLLEKTIRDCAAIMNRMVAIDARAKDVQEDGSDALEVWSTGPYILIKYLRILHSVLIDIKANGRPRIPGPVKTQPDGQIVAQVFPQTVYDKILYNGVTMDVWMQPGQTKEELLSSQGRMYTDENREGKVALVLGPGNISGMGPVDSLYKLFVEGRVVLFKTNPVNAYVGPLIMEGFKALIDAGFLRIVFGGAEEGSYLCNHPDIDEIHMVGSCKTFEAIVFGSGRDFQERKSRNEPVIKKRICGELGSVSPFILVPGPWSDADLVYHAEHLVTSLVMSAGFSCAAPRVIVNHTGWAQRQAFLDHVRKLLSLVPLRKAFYPASFDLYKIFMEEHPEAEQFGDPTQEQLPWALISDVDPNNKNDICFTTEAFCGIMAETALEAKSIPEHIDTAVEFCNEHLWGTLAATIIVHPKSLKDSAVAKAVERAVANLRYGTIGVNYWAGVAYVLPVSPWGAFPGHAFNDIQSGVGVANNGLMLSDTQKTVLRAPFRIKPKPIWFKTQHKTGVEAVRKMVMLEASPSLAKIPGILWSAMKSSMVAGNL